MKDQRGTIAVAAALAALAVAAALGAALAELSRVELRLAHERLVAAWALDAADACAAQALASLAPGWDFRPTIVGPDGRSGTTDDGRVDAPPGCTAVARAAPGALDPPRLLIAIDARAPHGHRALDLLVGRSPTPGLPGPLWLAALPGPGAITGSLELSGDDVATPVAGFGAPDEPAALDAWVAGEAPGLSLGPGVSPPVTSQPPPLRALGDRVLAGGPAGAEVLVESGAPLRALARVAGDLVVARALAGAGVLFIDGALDIRTSFDFTGLVVASGGVRVEGGASLTVRGALWIGAPPLEPALLVRGRAVLLHDRAALADADRVLELPGRAESLGVRDLG
jgi:hypothetical protein